jgi:hypothetical protein
LRRTERKRAAEIFFFKPQMGTDETQIFLIFRLGLIRVSSAAKKFFQKK